MLLGIGVRPDVVEVFDLIRRTKVDWFYCYQPRRVSEDWIAFKEFYHGEAQGSDVPEEVLLIYDLTKSPEENRLEKEPGQTLPVPIGKGSNYLVNVGFPIFPESNARQRSYQIVRESDKAGRSVDARTFSLLPSKKLVFRCLEQLPGMGNLGAREYLVLVDLSRGLENPQYQTVYFPKMGEHITPIDRIEADSPDTVRLVFPKGEYREDSMVVALPTQ
ncbi:MAG: hypothetical protein ACE141_06745 [Bryobacteraceae bacterium]